MSKTILIAFFIGTVSVMMMLSSLPVNAFTLIGDDDVPDPDVKKAKKEKEKIFICHVSPDNPEKVTLKKISKSSLQKHLDHGDYLPFRTSVGVEC